jgi:hypothetical protein
METTRTGSTVEGAAKKQVLVTATKGSAAAVIESGHPTLHQFLSANRAAILARARAKVPARPAPRATAEAHR